MKQLLFIFLQAGNSFSKNQLNDPNSLKEQFIVIMDVIFMVAPIIFFVTTMWFVMHFITATPESKTEFRRHSIDSSFCFIFSLLVLVVIFRLSPWLISSSNGFFGTIITLLVVLIPLISYFLFFRKKIFNALN